MFTITTPGGTVELEPEEFIEVCAAIRDQGKTEGCQPGCNCHWYNGPARSKMVALLKANEGHVPDNY